MGPGMVGGVREDLVEFRLFKFGVGDFFSLESVGIGQD